MCRAFAGGGRAHTWRRKDTHVALDMAAASFEMVAAIQFKYDITAAFSGDASRDVKRDDKGAVMFDSAGSIQLVTFATARHCGRVQSGTMAEPEGDDNYLGEMAAVLKALSSEAPGGRILIVLDATSPVRAWLKFRKRHHRTQMGYYGCEWLDALDQLVARHEVVVFLWQTSHVGAPVNEWADVLAGEAMNREQAGSGRRLPVTAEAARAVLLAETFATGQVVVCVGQHVGGRAGCKSADGVCDANCYL